jgi:hypothetical protein
MEGLEQNIKTESYKNAHDLHKFYVSFRFKIIAFLATANGALLFFWVEKTSDNYSKVFVALAGIVTCLCLWLLDRRNSELFEVCLKSASEVEKHANLGDFGIYTCLRTRPNNAVSHGRVIYYLSVLGIVAWVSSIISILVNIIG